MTLALSRQVLMNLCLAACALLMTGCGEQKSPPPGKVTISGSTTLLPVSEHWASMYTDQTGVLVNVQGGGSTNGINQVKSGQVDIGSSSRELSPEEQEGLRKIRVGKDVLVVIVNNKNPVKNISSQKLKEIFSGKINSWKVLGGPDRSIQVINREPGSGTRKTFEELVMCPEHANSCPDISLSSIVLNSNSEVKRTVAIIDDSIGYISHSFVDENVSGLKLNGIEANDDNINTDKYPLSRSLYYLVKDGTTGEAVAEYLKFIRTAPAQKALVEEGYFQILSK